jgi:hypothetical protein
MSDAELQKFKTEIDLRAYAGSHGYQLDTKASSAHTAVMRHLNNDKICIKKDSDGHWIYFSVRNDADNGSVIDFVKQRLHCSLGAARKELRRFMGLPAPVLPLYPPLRRLTRDRIRVEQSYARMKMAVSHPYLEDERAIPSEVLESRRFVGRIRMDARGNAVFPHFDADGLCGFELKNSDFTSFSPGGIKALWTSHIQDGDNRLLVCESAIDALSYAALFSDEHTRYASIGGKPSPVQKELVRATAALMPIGSTIVAAMDNDEEGRKLADMVLQAMKLTGRSDLRFEMHEPRGFKDWNDELRSRPKVITQIRGDAPSLV